MYLNHCQFFSLKYCYLNIFDIDLCKNYKLGN